MIGTHYWQFMSVDPRLLMTTEVDWNKDVLKICENPAFFQLGDELPHQLLALNQLCTCNKSIKSCNSD